MGDKGQLPLFLSKPPPPSKLWINADDEATVVELHSVLEEKKEKEVRLKENMKQIKNKNRKKEWKTYRYCIKRERKTNITHYFHATGNIR
jgi:hypothetical protein